MASSTLTVNTGSNDAGVGTIAWTSPSSVTSNDGTNATAGLAPYEQTQYLAAQTAGFSVPAGSTIDGIVVEYEASSDTATAIYDTSVRLVVNAAIIGNNNADVMTAWPTSPTLLSRGGASDKWGLTPIVDDVNTSGFGVAISVSNQGAGTAEARIDYVQVTVYYTTPTGGAGSATCVLTATATGASTFSATGASSAAGTASGTAAADTRGAGAAAAVLLAEAAGKFEWYADGSASASLSAAAVAKIDKPIQRRAIVVMGAGRRKYDHRSRSGERAVEPVIFNAATTPTLVIEVVDEDGAPRDVSAATRKRVVIRRPDGSELVKNLTNHTDGVDGKLQVTFEKSELPQPSRPVDYLYQVDLAVGTWDGPLSWCKFTVLPNLSRTLS